MEKNQTIIARKTQKIKDQAKLIGFSDIKIAPAIKLYKAQSEYQKYIQANKHGDMKYLESHQHLKTNPQEILPNCQSVIMFTLNYFRAKQNLTNKPTGKVARYAFGRDYHKVFKNKLKQISSFLQEEFPDSQFKHFADSGTLLERQYAELAGLGYIGKNTLLITLPHGSWVLIGEILTTQKLQYDKPSDTSQGVCGTCTRCQSACPTGALDEAYKINPTKCIAYHTIENKGTIPEELREKIGDWIFGCDICQEVCPHNFRQKPNQTPDFQKAIAGDSLDLKEILNLKTQEEFIQKYAGSPIIRAKLQGIQRNACIVAANTHANSLIPDIQNLLSLNPTNQVLQDHGNWALQKLLKLAPTTN